GTTLATNAIIERKGARTALLTTEGFRDILETGRELRYDLYDLSLEYPTPLAPRRFRLGIRERVDATGAVVAPLDPDCLALAMETIASAGIESVAICFLHSYANPAHEQEAGRRLKERFPKLWVSCSAEILPQIGEYPRASTTVANAYVQPLMAGYLTRMEDGLSSRGFRGRLGLITSNGGTADVRTAVAFPITLVESGPAAGVTATARIGRVMGACNLMAFDMGGTTAKLCLIRDGLPDWTAEFEVARLERFQRGSGLPIAIPSVDLIEIGAGGGSIARLDHVGLLQVGPESAGAAPGPACYGMGGDQPTVTDADLLLGFINPAYFCGGSLPLDTERARKAMGILADVLKRPVEAAAWAVFDTVTESMANAAMVHASEKGVDVRRATLLAFGGAGPVHAWAVAKRLGIRGVIVPTAAGVLSALGGLLAPTRFDLMQSMVADLDRLGPGQLRAVADLLVRQAHALLDQAGVAARDRHLTWSLDMKYSGQRYQVNVPVRGLPTSAAAVRALRRRFGQVYRERYGREVAGMPIEVVTCRLVAAGPDPRMPLTPSHCGTIPPAHRTVRPVWFGGRPVRTPVLRRESLGPGAQFRGPLIIEEADGTIVVPPGARGRLDHQGNIHMTLSTTIFGRRA
ncbi:MAG: hydantoinase/oxoprolinase family protein, partial [Candidatus Rokubacteria bacterium]|nr:hydantoinase/oxoprolinase family protein [Candidatus Rokubacteria bacterium]